MFKNPFSKKSGDNPPPDQFDMMSIISAVMEHAGALMFAKDKPAAVKKIVSDLLTAERVETGKTSIHKAVTEFENKRQCRTIVRITQAENQSDICLIYTEVSTVNFDDFGYPVMTEKVFYLSELTHDQIMYFINLIFSNNGPVSDTKQLNSGN